MRGDDVMAPLDLSALGHLGNTFVSVGIGFGFGFLLERAGLGNAKKLASQFYLDDQAVLKVMFTAIVVAMVLLYGSYGLGILDMERVWVNPTYLWPGIIGGLLLGVGFILGGYCPGTSVVAAATLKLDGLVFLAGCLLGIFSFGLTVPWFQPFWEQAGFLGRLTIPEWLGLSYGTVVLLVVLMALGMFAGAEWLEAWLSPERTQNDPVRLCVTRPVLAGANVLLALAAALAVYARFVPDPAAPRLRHQAEAIIASRERHIEPAELFSLMHNNQVTLRMFDARSEAEYNLFHLVDAERVEPVGPKNGTLKSIPPDAIKVVMSNDEARADEAATALMSRGVRNVYVLAGGLNNWLDTYGKGVGRSRAPSGTDTLRYHFLAALGANYSAAHPDLLSTPQLAFTPKVKFDRPLTKVSGGCGG
jgi:rhodanese-related sulfurtransferase